MNHQVLLKSHSLPPRPPVRHRASMQETKTKSASFTRGASSFSRGTSSFSRGTSFSKRRQDRHSSVTPPQFRLELSLLEHVQVEFVKAFVPANKLSQPRYVMRIANAALTQSWEMGRTFKEFYELKEAIVSVLDHGHFCHSNCPWLYMYATHHFPRRHLFRSRSPSVISARLTELQTFMNEILRMSREKRSLECAISADAFPRIVYDFLYEGMVFDRADFADTVLEDRMSMTGVTRQSSLDFSMGLPEEACSICRRSLLGGPEVSTTISPPSSRAGTTSTSSTSSDDHDAQSLTTLQCGHVFHDDCILKKLNEHLQCPLCADAETTTDEDVAT